MGPWDKQIEAQRQLIQSEVPEPIVAYSILQPAGTRGAYGLKNLSPGIGMWKQHKANNAAGDVSNRRTIQKNPCAVRRPNGNNPESRRGMETFAAAFDAGSASTGLTPASCSRSAG